MRDKDKNLDEKIIKAVASATPDVLDQILSQCQEREEKVIYMNNRENINPAGKVKKRNPLSRLVAVAAMVAVVVGAGFGYNGYQTAFAVESTVAIDVNPSVELKVNKNEKVVEVNPISEDGKKVIEGIELKGVQLEVAVYALMGSMVEKGYISDLQNSILLTVEGDNPAINKSIETKVTEKITSILGENKISPAIVSQVVEKNENLTKQAEAYNLSSGKTSLINSILETSPNYKFENLAGLSINDLNLIATSKKVELPNATNTGVASQKNYIGEAKAVQIAQAHSGVSSMVFSEVEMDWEFDRMVYEVDFKGNGLEFEYVVDAVTGEILKVERDGDDLSNLLNPSGNSSAQVTGGSSDKDQPANVSAGGEGLTKDQALALALKDAGLTKDQVHSIEIDVEVENGQKVYELSFDHMDKEYEYEILASSGKIKSKNID